MQNRIRPSRALQALLVTTLIAGSVGLAPGNASAASEEVSYVGTSSSAGTARSLRVGAPSGTNAGDL